MASREIISYDKGVLVKSLKWGSPIFLAFYLIWSLLPLFIMLMASMKRSALLASRELRKTQKPDHSLLKDLWFLI